MHKKWFVRFLFAAILSLGNWLYTEDPSPWPATVEAELPRGVDAATGLAMKMRINDAAGLVGLEPLMNRAIELFKSGEQDKGLQLMEVAWRVFPGDLRSYSVLAQLYWYAGELKKSREFFGFVLGKKENNPTAREYWRRLNFVPDAFAVPLEMKTAHLLLRPLKESDAELDYHAVMGSIEHIRKSFAPEYGWPTAELTLEQDRKALRMHEKEFGQRIAFVYTVMNHLQDECLGCVYIYPSYALGYDADVTLWVTEKACAAGLESELKTALDDWFASGWPFAKVMYPGRTVAWEEYAKLTDDWEKHAQSGIR